MKTTLHLNGALSHHERYLRLNAAVYEHVLGYIRGVDDEEWLVATGEPVCYLPSYSTNGGAALELVSNHLGDYEIVNHPDGGHQVCVWLGERWQGETDSDGHPAENPASGHGIAPTIAEAICHAFLRANGVEVVE